MVPWRFSRCRLEGEAGPGSWDRSGVVCECKEPQGRIVAEKRGLHLVQGEPDATGFVNEGAGAEATRADRSSRGEHSRGTRPEVLSVRSCGVAVRYCYRVVDAISMSGCPRHRTGAQKATRRRATGVH